MEPRLVFSSTFLSGTSEEKLSNSDPYSKPVLYVLKALGRGAAYFK